MYGPVLQKNCWVGHMTQLQRSRQMRVRLPSTAPEANIQPLHLTSSQSVRGVAMASGCKMKEFTHDWWKSARRLLRILSCVTLSKLLLPSPRLMSSLSRSHTGSSDFAS